MQDPWMSLKAPCTSKKSAKCSSSTRGERREDMGHRRVRSIRRPVQGVARVARASFFCIGGTAAQEHVAQPPFQPVPSASALCTLHRVGMEPGRSRLEWQLQIRQQLEQVDTEGIVPPEKPPWRRSFAPSSAEREEAESEQEEVFPVLPGSAVRLVDASTLNRIQVLQANTRVLFKSATDDLEAFTEAWEPDLKVVSARFAKHSKRIRKMREDLLSIHRRVGVLKRILENRGIPLESAPVTPSLPTSALESPAQTLGSGESDAAAEVLDEEARIERAEALDEE